jgi:hypothetical protein
MAGLVPDANTLILSKILAQGISQIQKMQKTYERITEFTQISNQTRDEISALLKLESDTRNALLIAQNIKDLKISDIQYFLKQNLDLKGNPDDYIISSSFLNQMLAEINKGSLNGKMAIDLYRGMHSLVGTDSPSGDPLLSGFGESASFQKNIFDQIGLESYIQDQNSKTYQMMINFAGRYQEQALELESLIKTDNLFSMNTSERMNLMIQAGNLLERAVKLKMEANQILMSKPGESLEAQKKALELVLTQKDLVSRLDFSHTYSLVLFP